jgi:hypothetical protein
VRAEVHALLRTASTVFAFTVVVGILNGADLVEFDRRALLAHVHAGTLGWITLGVFAASLWLFGEGARPGPVALRWARGLTVAAVLTVPTYAFAFLLTYGVWRPILGTLVVLVIGGFLAWVLVRARAVELTTPHLGILAAVATSITGGVLGVLLGVLLATGTDALPLELRAAHPGTMVVGFLVPVGMALAECGLAGARPAPLSRRGTLQVALPFIGGITLMAGLLLDIVPLIALSLPFEVIGVGLLVTRLWPRLRAIRWGEPAVERRAGAAVGSLAAAIALLVYLIVRYEGDVDAAPVRLILATDHLMFIGVLTNGVLGLLARLDGEGTTGPSAVDQFTFWALNVGLLGFAVGLLFDVTALIRVSAPVMGMGILAALVAAPLRPRGARVPRRVPAP